MILCNILSLISMKRILYPVLLLFALGCAKEKSSTGFSTEIDSNYVWLPTGVYTYFNSAGDTVVYDRFDSLYYTADLKIDKVVSTGLIHHEYKVVNQFVYNSDGSINSLTVSADDEDYYPQHFLFFYGSNGKLDSLTNTYPAHSYPQQSWTFDYDANNHLKHVRSFNVDQNITLGVADYFRNNNAELDSIVTSPYLENNGLNRITLRPGGKTVLDISGLDRAYLFLMANQDFDRNLVNSSTSPYWHQYINPDIPLLKGGIFSGIDYSGKPLDAMNYILVKTLNANGTVKMLSLIDHYASTDIYKRRDKFVYGKFPK